MRHSVPGVVAFCLAACLLAPAKAAGTPETEIQAEESENSIVLSGIASWYAVSGRTASGERFDRDGLTAAHRTLPLGTRVIVSHAKTGKSIQVTINDRGPFVRGRLIDLSEGAARELGMADSGTAPVIVSVAMTAEAEKAVEADLILPPRRGARPRT